MLDGVVDENVDEVKLYQQILDTCVNSGSIPFDLLKNCAYDRTRYLAEKDNITSADFAVQQFKKLSVGDKRTPNLENIVQGRVKNLLIETAKIKIGLRGLILKRKLVQLSFHLHSLIVRLYLLVQMHLRQ